MAWAQESKTCLGSTVKTPSQKCVQEENLQMESRLACAQGQEGGGGTKLIIRGTARASPWHDGNVVQLLQ